MSREEHKAAVRFGLLLGESDVSPDKGLQEQGGMVRDGEVAAVHGGDSSRSSSAEKAKTCQIVEATSPWKLI